VKATWSLMLVTVVSVLLACSETVDSTSDGMAPSSSTVSDDQGEDRDGGSTAAEAPQPLTLEVDWQRAAETSAGGLQQEIAPLRITLPLPDGWTPFQRWALLKRDANPPAGAGITFERPLALYADRCRWDDPEGLIEIGPTIDDFVDALVDHPEYGATNVTDIVVDGFAGKAFDMLGVADDFDLTECSRGGQPYLSQERHFHRPWAGRHWMGATEMNHVRVVDVAGERVVVRGLYFSETSDQDVAELFGMLDAIRIEVEH
jgi:hypothetical protein